MYEIPSLSFRIMKCISTFISEYKITIILKENQEKNKHAMLIQLTLSEDQYITDSGRWSSVGTPGLFLTCCKMLLRSIQSSSDSNSVSAFQSHLLVFFLFLFQMIHGLASNKAIVNHCWHSTEKWCQPLDDKVLTLSITLLVVLGKCAKY